MSGCKDHIVSNDVCLHLIFLPAITLDTRKFGILGVPCDLVRLQFSLVDDERSRYVVNWPSFAYYSSGSCGKEVIVGCVIHVVTIRPGLAFRRITKFDSFSCLCNRNSLFVDIDGLSYIHGISMGIDFHPVLPEEQGPKIC